MTALMTLVLGTLTYSAPIELAPDVHEITTPKFALPVSFDPNQKAQIAKVRLFISRDKGRTWELTHQHGTNIKEFQITTTADGEYWFRVQVENKDGSTEPRDIAKADKTMKVFVNSKRAVLKPRQSREDLLRENESLRQKIQNLEKRVEQLESILLRRP